jgi:2-polyprenyl-3-methyl-5-hydroxy-6-metoxy-1,4-benzoquinol methylase
MNKSDFSSYKNRFLVAIRSVLEQANPGSLDEAAFPAYSHRNLLINYLFWERIRKVINYVEKGSPYNTVLDFGCGSGVLLPFLSTKSNKVIAADIDLNPLEKIKQFIHFPQNIEFIDLMKNTLEDFPPATINMISALDVLEHVENLQQTLETLCKLLKPGGKIIISGPTENIIYKAGRVFAGPEYTGDYHQWNIYQIRKILSSILKVKRIATLYYPITFFEVFCGTM